MLYEMQTPRQKNPRKKLRSIAYRMRREGKQQKAVKRGPQDRRKKWKTSSIPRDIDRSDIDRKEMLIAQVEKRKRNKRHHHHPRFQRNLEHHHHYSEYRKGQGQQN